MLKFFCVINFHGLHYPQFFNNKIFPDYGICQTLNCPLWLQCLLTPFAVNGSCIITLCIVFVQGIQVLDTLNLYLLWTLDIPHLPTQ